MVRFHHQAPKHILKCISSDYLNHGLIICAENEPNGMEFQ
uniref:Uncharacterized protein n=1 Tax=Salmonella phage vB_SEnST11_KE22 TaxID=3161173 RepID=A0AAU8GEI5_9CAUD